MNSPHAADDGYNAAVSGGLQSPSDSDGAACKYVLPEVPRLRGGDDGGDSHVISLCDTFFLPRSFSFSLDLPRPVQ